MRKGATRHKQYKTLDLQPDLRDYKAAASIVLQIAGPDREITLITNNPNKVVALREQGVNVISRMPLVCLVNERVESYLSEKSRVLGHKLDHD